VEKSVEGYGKYGECGEYGEQALTTHHSPNLIADCSYKERHDGRQEFIAD
jgi:hypothetical protein